MIHKPRYAAAVVGGGPAGLAAALALAEAGLDVALAGPPHRPAGPSRDQRTAALFAGSITLLKNLGVWDGVASYSEPIKGIRLIDDREAFLRAPEVVFTAEEAGLDVFGFNVPNEELVAALRKRALSPGSGVDVIETAGVEKLELGAGTARLHLKEGTSFEAPLVAGADGRGSLCRAAAGITTKSWSYPQAALACWFTHTRGHNQISTEFHRAAGPFTVVPLPGLASSLVWVEEPQEAQRLAALDDEALRQTLERRLQGLLGSLTEIGPRTVFPLSGLTADVFARNRVALIGEAGHVIPPIGAQGLNLGFRDGAALADSVADAMGAGRDIGGAETMSTYSSLRAPDVTQRIWTVDLLNRSLISPLLPVHLLRGLGLFALKAVGPLRRALIHEGLQPSYSVPSLMQTGGPARLAARAGRKVEHARPCA